MLKHIIYTSVALVLASTPFIASAVDSNFTHPPITPSHDSVFANHHSAAPKNSNQTASVPQIELQPSHHRIPAQPLKPNHHWAPATPASTMYPQPPMPVYEGLETGHHDGIIVDIQNCSLMSGSDTPTVDIDNVFFSTENGSKVLDPEGDAKTVYHFSNENVSYTDDLDEVFVNRYISISKDDSKIVIRSAVISNGGGNVQPKWHSYKYSCNNKDVHFETK